LQPLHAPSPPSNNDPHPEHPFFFGRKYKPTTSNFLGFPQKGIEIGTENCRKNRETYRHRLMWRRWW